MIIVTMITVIVMTTCQMPDDKISMLDTERIDRERFFSSGTMFNSPISLASQRSPLHLRDITWMDSQTSSAETSWPFNWLIQLKKLNWKEPVSVEKYSRMIFNHPNGSQVKCFNSYRALAACDYLHSQALAAVWLANNSLELASWDRDPELFSRLESSGLHQLASTLFHLFRCMSGHGDSCPRPCLQQSPCGHVVKGKPGGCSKIDPSATAGMLGMTYNLAWLYQSVRCDCQDGYHWNDLTRSCELVSTCRDRTPCVDNNTESCLDLPDFQFQCGCKPGYFGQLCEQEDLCVTERLCGKRGECVHVDGRFHGLSYQCRCHHGFDDDASDDRPDCLVDVQDLIVDESAQNRLWRHWVLMAAVLLGGVCAAAAILAHCALCRRALRWGSARAARALVWGKLTASSALYATGDTINELLARCYQGPMPETAETEGKRSGDDTAAASHDLPTERTEERRRHRRRRKPGNVMHSSADD